MKVKVCDALCGAGKTLSCINMMNSDTSHKYIFVTPYLNEVERIKRSCSGRGFVSPEKKITNGYSKLHDLPELLKAGRNIVSTHALFSSYTDEIKDLIREQHYILVLDEVIDLFQPVDLDYGDVEFLKKNKIISENENGLVWEDNDYNGVVFDDVMRISKSRDMIDYDGSFYFWSLPIDVFNCFDSAYVLTYMFEYQFLKYFFQVNNVEYELIGTIKKNDIYQFCPIEEMDRKKDLKRLIHVIDSEKYNRIGNKPYSLSSSWFDRAYKESGQPKLRELKNNLYNIFRHKGTNQDNKLWTTLTKYRNSLKGKGYSNSFLTFNRKATNDYVNKKYLAYCLNVFMMPWMKNYLVRLGVNEVNQDMYALSILIQWIFRSAVRRGEEVYLYIPSRRMRTLLVEWLDNLKVGDDLKEIKFNTKRNKRAEEENYAYYCKK